MKIVKPDLVDVLFRCFRPGERPALALGVLKVFPLAVKEGERSEPLPAVWPLVKQALGTAVLDAGLPKARGEFLAYGCAYPPAGFGRQPLLVELAVGEVSKPLAVFGDREFGPLAGASSPKPFARLPITPENAFGGDGFADNPLGKGYAALADERWPLPNIESPAQLIVHRGDRAAPAGFWARSPDAPAKLRLLGRCDARWQATRWPHLPLDTAPDYFQAAPEDQRFTGFLRGDEKIVIRHMHPQFPLVESALPGLRARCFVHRPGLAPASSGFGEIPAHAETVWLFPEHDCGLILFRALAPVADDDGDDVAYVFVELENLDQPPLPLAHYWQRFAERVGLAPPVKMPPADAPAALPPAATPAAAAPAAPAVDPSLDALAALANSPAIAEIEKMTAQVDAQLKALMAQHGLTPADVEKYLAKPAADAAPMSLADIEKTLAEVEGQTQQLMARHGIAPTDLERYLAPPVAKPAGGAEELGELLAQAEQQAQALIARSKMSEAQLKAALAGHPDLAAAIDGFLAPKGAPVDLAALFAQVAALTPAVAAPPPAAEAAKPASEPAPAAPERLDRAGVIARHAAGQSLVACDLCGVDLSGLDLRGADFSGAQLAGASFAGSRLAGAKFADALLQKADFSAAELDGASLTGASADGASFAGSRLCKCDASQADFSGGDFSGADLGLANLCAALFSGARMAGVKAAGCVADKASFEDCDLSDACFAQARVNGARFNGANVQRADFSAAFGQKAEFFKVDARNANFSAATLSSSRANDTSDFSDANLRGATLSGVHWAGALLSRALLGEALLDRADLSRCRLDGASLLRASAKEARLDKAELDGADLSYINLFKGSLRLAKLGSARLQMANLYGVNFYGTTPTATCILGANIDRTSLHAG